MNENIKIAFPVTREEHIEIENISSSEGKSFNEYFMGLHREHMGDIRKFSKADMDLAVKQALDKSKGKKQEVEEDAEETESPSEAEEKPTSNPFKKKGRPKKQY
jgi:hypothetical protein